MAVSLPVMVLVYALLFHPPVRYARQTIYAWAKREGRVALCGAGLTLIFIAGKLVGPDPLTAVPAYRPVFTVHNFLDTTARLLNSLSFIPFFNDRNVAVALIVFAFNERHTAYVQSWLAPQQEHIWSVIEEVHRTNPDIRQRQQRSVSERPI
jgi:hypothetical protein